MKRPCGEFVHRFSKPQEALLRFICAVHLCDSHGALPLQYKLRTRVCGQHWTVLSCRGRLLHPIARPCLLGCAHQRKKIPTGLLWSLVSLKRQPRRTAPSNANSSNFQCHLRPVVPSMKSVPAGLHSSRKSIGCDAWRVRPLLSHYMPSLRGLIQIHSSLF